ncbi:DUF6455 family protein [Ruegeria sp. HKCCD7255]|uniref:DUF6455 family protein n=1 Tax=Ruegeria sp. HKCCD7255 TaxID=2683004 RepID=UPI001489FD6A|nr:DUF6455 family protein [Ruegeria sp. HKCCD7255]
MTDRQTLKRHAELVDDMASTLGVDLEEATLRGELEFGDIADAVLRCTQCPNPVHCQSFLAETSSAIHTPDYCRNKGLLERLTG